MLGEAARVTPWALGGAVVLPADDPGEVRAAWSGLTAGIDVVLLTPAAAEALAGLDEPVLPEQRTAGPMTVVLP